LEITLDELYVGKRHSYGEMENMNVQFSEKS